MTPTIPTSAAVARVITFELRRAREEHPEAYDSRSAGLVVLVEEVGEVAEAIQRGSRQDMLSELAQVAAVAVRMMEQEVNG